MNLNLLIGYILSFSERHAKKDNFEVENHIFECRLVAPKENTLLGLIHPLM